MKLKKVTNSEIDSCIEKRIGFVFEYKGHVIENYPKGDIAWESHIYKNGQVEAGTYSEQGKINSIKKAIDRIDSGNIKQPIKY